MFLKNMFQIFNLQNKQKEDQQVYKLINMNLLLLQYQKKKLN